MNPFVSTDIVKMLGNNVHLINDKLSALSLLLLTLYGLINGIYMLNRSASYSEYLSYFTKIVFVGISILAFPWLYKTFNSISSMLADWIYSSNDVNQLFKKLISAINDSFTKEDITLWKVINGGLNIITHIIVMFEVFIIMGMDILRVIMIYFLYSLAPLMLVTIALPINIWRGYLKAFALCLILPIMWAFLFQIQSVFINPDLLTKVVSNKASLSLYKIVALVCFLGVYLRSHRIALLFVSGAESAFADIAGAVKQPISSMMTGLSMGAFINALPRGVKGLGSQGTLLRGGATSLRDTSSFVLNNAIKAGKYSVGAMRSGIENNRPDPM